MHLTAVRNWWEFAAPAIAAETLRAGGYAVRKSHLLRFDSFTGSGRRPAPGDPDFAAPVQTEPHHLLTWAGRRYLVAFVPVTDGWQIFRVDRIRPYASTGLAFTRRPPPDDDVAR